MVQSTHLVATIVLMLSGETSGLASHKLRTRSLVAFSSKKLCSTTSKHILKNATEFRGNRSHCQSTSRLTSTYVEARNLKRSWFPGRTFQWTSNLFHRRGCRRWKVILSIIFAAILIFAPAFSPANASDIVSSAASHFKSVPSSTTVFTTQSRALGTFHFLPSKAELELSFRLLYAACSGAFVGLERSSSDRPAGVRTMALVGLGACIYTICSTHGFLPHSALGYAPGSPMLANVKCDPGRMASNVASGVGFIGAGAIHKSKLHGNGTEAQNVVAGLTTAAAIWVSAAVGVASAVGLYFVGAVASLSTVAILKYAKVPKEDELGPSWRPRPLAVVEENDNQRKGYDVHGADGKQTNPSGLFGKSYEMFSGRQSNGHNIKEDDFENNRGLIARYAESHRPIIVKEVIDPHLEEYLRNRLMSTTGGFLGQDQPVRESKVLIEEEQQVLSTNNNTDNEQDLSLEP